jgi:hypothetical protein
MNALSASGEAGAKKFSGVKVFSATMFEQRQHLGEVVTAWIAAHPELSIVDIVQTQSSDSAFHCISVTVFYTERVSEERPSEASATKRTRRSAS